MWYNLHMEGLDMFYRINEQTNTATGSKKSRLKREIDRALLVLAAAAIGLSVLVMGLSVIGGGNVYDAAVFPVCGVLLSASFAALRNTILSFVEYAACGREVSTARRGSHKRISASAKAEMTA